MPVGFGGAARRAQAVPEEVEEEHDADGEERVLDICESPRQRTDSRVHAARPLEKRRFRGRRLHAPLSRTRPSYSATPCVQLFC